MASRSDADDIVSLITVRTIINGGVSYGNPRGSDPDWSLAAKSLSTVSALWGTRYVRWCRGVGGRGLRTCLLSGSEAVGSARGGWPGAYAQRGVQVMAWAAGAWWGRPPVCSARGVG